MKQQNLFSLMRPKISESHFVSIISVPGDWQLFFFEFKSIYLRRFIRAITET